MKTLSHNAITLTLLAASLQAQSPPPGQPAKPPKAPWTERFLFSADATLRVMDANTTYNLLNDPCHCFQERDPIAPKGKGMVQISAFQASAGASVINLASFLKARGHRKLAYTVLLVDIGSEIWAVQNNMRLEPPKGTTK
jgi:hypothetical protein